jgi:hypothetical protein
LTAATRVLKLPATAVSTMSAAVAIVVVDSASAPASRMRNCSFKVILSFLNWSSLSVAHSMPIKSLLM